MATDKETMAQEFNRLVAEHDTADNDTSEKAEAWNLVADFALENADFISAALTAAEQVRAAEPGMARDAAIEAAAKAIYTGKGDRVGKDYIGWDNELDDVKNEWRVDVRATIDAYEAAVSLD